jgi:hypothetical protein
VYPLGLVAELLHPVAGALADADAVVPDLTGALAVLLA